MSKLVCRVAFLILICAVFIHRAHAEIYEINRSLSDGMGVATLTGTLEIPIGSYLIENEAPSPFTGVDLTMVVNSVAYDLPFALTDVINGNGQFRIEATASKLTFDAAGDGGNPADLVFADGPDSFAANRWVIGSNGAPIFETALSDSGNVILNEFDFPVDFGTVVPEPSHGLCSLTLLWIAFVFHIRRNRR